MNIFNHPDIRFVRSANIEYDEDEPELVDSVYCGEPGRYTFYGVRRIAVGCVDPSDVYESDWEPDHELLCFYTENHVVVVEPDNAGPPCCDAPYRSIGVKVYPLRESTPEGYSLPFSHSGDMKEYTADHDCTVQYDYQNNGLEDSISLNGRLMARIVNERLDDDHLTDNLYMVDWESALH